MDCYFWTFSKPKNSTKRPSLNDATIIPANVATSDLDLERPQLVFNLGTSQEDTPTAYNMVYIPALERYYRCTWRAVDAMWIAECEEDTLATWKTEIGALNAYVLRSSAEWDGNIIDNMYPAKTTIQTEQSSGTSPWNTDPTSGTFVVGIVGSGATQYLMFTYAAFNLFLQYLLSDAYALAALGTLGLATHEELKAVLDPLQYISSIVWLPFTATGTAVSSVRVGYVNVAVAAWDIGTGIRVVDIDWNMRRHPQAATRGAYLSASMAGYTLHYPPFGMIALDPVICANTAAILTSCLIDLKTGHASLTIATQEARIVSRISGQVGLPYQVGQVVAPGYGLTGMLSDLSSIGIAAITQDYPGMIAGGLSAVGNATKARIPSANTVGGVGGLDQLRGVPTFQYEWMIPVDEDLADRGRPLCKVRQISTLSGFIMCSNVEVNIAATPNEIDTIKAYMEGGFYYE